MSVKVNNTNPDGLKSAISKFGKESQSIIRELRAKEFHQTKSEKRKSKSIAARKLLKKNLKKDRRDK